MTTRAEQRAETSNRILLAAVKEFSEKGFRAASTRDIAKRAGVNQGLITYYFKNKDTLWKAAAGSIFDQLREALELSLEGVDAADPRAASREQVREYVRFAAAYPELFRLLVEEGKRPDARMRWLVDTYMKPFYEQFRQVAERVWGVRRSDVPHVFYAMAGGASMMFALRPECRRLTGLDPADSRAVETHAELMARMLVP